MMYTSGFLFLIFFYRKVAADVSRSRKLGDLVYDSVLVCTAELLWYKKPPAGFTRIIGFILKVPDGVWPVWNS
jgi:hypothetical protein